MVPKMIKVVVERSDKARIRLSKLLLLFSSFNSTCVCWHSLNSNYYIMLIDLFQNLASVNAFLCPIFLSMRNFILNSNLVTRSSTASWNPLCVMSCVNVIIVFFNFVGCNQSLSQQYTGCIRAVHYIGLIGKRGSPFTVSQAWP